MGVAEENVPVQSGVLSEDAAKKPLLETTPTDAAGVVTPAETAPVDVAAENAGHAPFWSIYAVFFVLGLFFHPFFLVGGMFGILSNKPHAVWAGRMSVITVALIIAGFIGLNVLHQTFEPGTEATGRTT